MRRHHEVSFVGSRERSIIRINSRFIAAEDRKWTAMQTSGLKWYPEDRQ
ncbi:hypothetical protein [Paenibacillus sp. sgz500958]